MNRLLDRLAYVEIRLRSVRRSAFRLCGYTGLTLGIPLSLLLTLHRGLSPLIMLTVILSGTVSFFALTIATRVVTGKEQLVYYHHEIAVLTVAGLLLWLMRQPILPYLDALALGIGMFLVCGRIGCLMVGCCHGRPCRWGVCYGDDHAAAGFTPYYVGTRLFPIQGVESVWVLCTVITGSFIVWRGGAPGIALACYVVLYDAGRFCFEFIRGDPERPYHLGFSEAQWISVVLALGLVGVEWNGALPFQAWHAAIALGLLVLMVTVAAYRQLHAQPKYHLLHPHHVREFAEAIGVVSRLAASAPSELVPSAIRVAQTSEGVYVSAGCVNTADGSIPHWTLSWERGALPEESVRSLMPLIAQIAGTTGRLQLVPGRHGTFHIFLHHTGTPPKRRT